MELAHGAVVEGGPALEILLVGGALIAIGVMFFFQKAAGPFASLVFVVIGAAVVVGGFAFSGDGASSSGIDVHITSPADGTLVRAGRPITIDVDLVGAELGTSGHLHVFIDGRLASMPSSTSPTVTVPPGEHVISVEYVNIDHGPLDPPVTDKVQVTAR